MKGKCHQDDKVRYNCIGNVKDAKNLETISSSSIPLLPDEGSGIQAGYGPV